MTRASLQRLVRVASRRCGPAGNLNTRQRQIFARQLSTENPSNASIDGVNHHANEESAAKSKLNLSSELDADRAASGTNLEENTTASHEESIVGADASLESHGEESQERETPSTENENVEKTYSSQVLDSMGETNTEEGLTNVKTETQSNTISSLGSDDDAMHALYSELRYVNRNFGMYQLYQRYQEAANMHSVFSAEIYNLVIPVMARLKFLTDVKRSLGAAHENGIKLFTDHYNAILYAYMKKGYVNDIRDLIDFMWSAGEEQRPDAYSYNKLIGALFYRRNVQDAFTVLEEMKEKGIVPALSTYLTLIFGCVKASEARRAYEVFQTLEKSGAEIPAASIAHLLVACAQDRDIEAVSDLLDKFENAFPRYRTTVEKLIERESSNYASKSFYATSDFNTPWEESRLRLEMSAFDPVLQTAYDASNDAVANRAWKLLQEAYSSEEIPVRLWYKAVGANGRAGNFDQAFQLISEYEETYGSRMKLNELMESVVEPLAKNLGEVDKLYYGFRDSMESGTALQSSDESSNAAAEASSLDSQENDEDGLDKPSPEVNEVAVTNPSAVEERVNKTPKASLTALNCLVAACARAKDVDRTFQTFDDIVNVFGITRDTDSYNALLFALLGRSHESSVQKVVDDMENSNVELDEETIRLIIQSKITIGRSLQGIGWVRYAQDHKIPVSIRAYQNLLASFVKFPEVPTQRIEEVLTLGLQEGHLLTAMLSKLRHKDKELIWSIRREMDERSSETPRGSDVHGSGATLPLASDNSGVEPEKPEEVTHDDVAHEASVQVQDEETTDAGDAPSDEMRATEFSSDASRSSGVDGTGVDGAGVNGAL